jgi:UDP-glucose 4-epimerase
MIGPVLITGGAGFIGSHLADKLLEEDERVIVLDDLSTGSLVNVTAAATNSNFEFVQGSVTDAPLMHRLARKVNFVVHLAATVGVQAVLANPLAASEQNIQGCVIALKASKAQGIPILIASTAEVYGRYSSSLLTENQDLVFGQPSVPRWSYAFAKAMNEVFAATFSRDHGLPTIVVRLFNTSGARQSPAYGMVIPRFVRQALRNAPIEVYGDGRQRRCFCHVADTTEAMLGLMKSSAAFGGVFNIGSAEEISIISLAEMVRGRTDSSSPIKFVSYRDAYGCRFEDIFRARPDTSKIRETTGWHPQRNLGTVIDDIAIEECPSRDSP